MVVVRSKSQATKKAQTPAKKTVAAKTPAAKTPATKIPAKVTPHSSQAEMKELKVNIVKVVVEEKIVKNDEDEKLEEVVIEENVKENAPKPESSEEIALEAEDAKEDQSNEEVAEEVPNEGEDVEEVQNEEEDVEEVKEECNDSVEEEDVEEVKEECNDSVEEEAIEEEPNDADDNNDDADPFDIEEELKKKVSLPDGTEEFIYSRGPKYQSGLWPINCHLCRYGNISNDELFQKHVNSKKHMRKLSQPVQREKFVAPYYQRPYKNLGLDKPIMILPGEFIEEIGEKYKDRIIKIDDRYSIESNTCVLPEILKQIQEEKIHEYNKKLPVMGLCYAAKIHNNRKAGASYYCALCQTKIFGEAYQHFVGTNHQAKYIIKHFPKLYDKVVKGLATLKNTTMQTRMVRNIFRKLYRKIENAKGLRTITFIKIVNFNRSRASCDKRLVNAKHYGEKTILITDEEVETLISKSIKGISFIKPDAVSLEKTNKNIQPPPDRKRTRESTPPRERRNIPPPPSISGEPASKSRRQPDRFLDDPRDWQTYRTMIGTVIDELDQVYEEYAKAPESHPDYNDEWRTFWRRRCTELERDNIDPRYYDFDKEWIPYWLRRLRELHEKDIVRRKFEMKRTLRLSYDRRSPSPIRQLRRPQRSPTPPGRNNSGNSNRYRGGNNTDDNAHTPADQLSVISVLRLLTALEDQLGSLGPKAVQLLSRAVVLEKNDQNTNELLLDNDFQLFFLTSKEKLKGQLMANVVEPIKVHAANKAINDLTNILNMFDEYMNKRRGDQRPAASGNINNVNQYEGQNRNQFHGNNNNQMNMNENQFGTRDPSFLSSVNQFNRNQNVQPNYGGREQTSGIWQRSEGNNQGRNTIGDNFSPFNNPNKGNFGMNNNSVGVRYPDTFNNQRSGNSTGTLRNFIPALFTGGNFSGNTSTYRANDFNRNMTRY